MSTKAVILTWTDINTNLSLVVDDTLDPIIFNSVNEAHAWMDENDSRIAEYAKVVIVQGNE